MNQSEGKITPFNLYGEEYDRWFDTQGKIIFKNEVELFKKMGAHKLHPSLEIGSGSGRFTKALSIDFAVEPSETLRRISIKNGVIPIVGRGEHVPFDNEVFQAVFLIVTLCFLDDPVQVLKESYRILKKDGFLVLGLVLKNSPWGRFYLGKKKKGHKFYSYARFYTLEEVHAILKLGGFDIIDVYSTLLSSPPHSKDEEPVHGYIEEAGFTGIIASKIK